MKTELPPSSYVQTRKQLAEGVKYVDISQAGHPDGAEGCGKCRYGILGDTRTDGPGPVYLLRYYQAQAHTIEFCGCAAGQAYRRYLLKCHAEIQNGRDTVSSALRGQIVNWIEALPTPVA